MVMKLLISLFVVLIGYSAFAENTEDGLIKAAKKHIYNDQNIPKAEDKLYLALEHYNSAEAAVLLSQLEIGKKHPDQQSNWYNFVARLTQPYLNKNGDAAFLHGITLFPRHPEKTL